MAPRFQLRRDRRQSLGNLAQALRVRGLLERIAQPAGIGDAIAGLADSDGGGEE